MKWSALFGPDSLPYGRNGNTSIGSNFSKIAFHHGDGIWASMMGVDVNHWDGLVLVLKDPSGQNWKVVKTNRALRYGSRYDFIVRTQGATIQLFVNGELWAQSEMHPDLIGVPPESAHAGLYGYGFPVGAYLFNGPMETDIWFR